MSTSQKIRDEATLLLAALASRKVADDDLQGESFFEFAGHLDVSDAGICLARAAYDAIPARLHGADFELECCEASLLVESGWEDGDPLELLHEDDCNSEPTGFVETEETIDIFDEEEIESDDALDHADPIDELEESDESDE